jgi:hypothetical protein
MTPALDRIALWFGRTPISDIAHPAPFTLECLNTTVDLRITCYTVGKSPTMTNMQQRLSFITTAFPFYYNNSKLEKPVCKY